MKAILFLLLLPAVCFGQTLEFVGDINTAGSADPRHLTVCNNVLYFSAVTPALGRELWAYDGVNPPKNIQDLNPGSANAFETYVLPTMGVLNNTLYYCATNGALGLELMSYTGTGNPTLFKDFVPGADPSMPSNFYTVGNTMYFTVADTAHGYEMNTYNGVGQPVVHELMPGAVFGGSCYDYTEYKGNIYFSGFAPNGSEPFYYNPASGSYTLMPDTSIHKPVGFLNYNNILYFVAAHTGFIYDLYSYDGITITQLTHGENIIPSFYTGLVGYKGKIIFLNEKKSNNKIALSYYDLQTKTVQVLQDIYPNKDVNADYFTEYKSDLYFSANDSLHGTELWVYDGTNAKLYADINPDTNSAMIQEIKVFGNDLYFSANDGTHGLELYRIHDTTTGNYINKLVTPNVEIYPNPLRDVLNIHVTQAHLQPASISIISMTGALMIRKQFVADANGKIRLDVSHLPAGQYILEYRAPNVSLVQHSFTKL